ncbi:MAG: glycosyl hydrolase, partial [Flavobacteriales bacterium]|nr:glycosyl hydrolase [Flavobacteriales bacterium]
MKKILFATLSILITLALYAKKGEEKKDEGKYKTSTFSGLKFRNIGPALTSGRVADIAVNPTNSAEYYVAVASGGVWKTTNHGTTYSPIFDGQGSYSIGCVTIDPSNPHTIWVGTGENNNQRSVAYGDGVYKSNDGGKSWINVGLKKSEHIGKIIVHPNNSNIVYVAAYGPLWSEGGDRGLYKTEDGGKKWAKVLEIDEHTGISDIVMDSRNPDIIYAAAHQRRRHTFTYVGGGPSSGIHKTIDGGKNWDKLTSGLPSTTMGRIGLAISPVNPDYVFAMIEAEQDKQGFYRSTNRGASWTKMSKHKTSGNYYQEIICDPVDLDKVFSMDTWLHHTEDGGKTFQKTGEKSKHVDNHCIWINPNNTNHWIVGCDGGLYETWDHAANWQYKPNLPVTQYYKVAVDNAKPFYNVYGGTQDNNSMGGPSRTTTNHGIMNSDWYITNGGDGFESAIDPIDPNIVYAQAQYGWLVRYDKATGERVGIQPQPKADEDGLRWNWDAPLIISPHNNKRLYFAANKLFKSNDQGNTWECISEDLTRQIDRNTLKVMGRVQSIDAVMKNKSTTMYGNIVALDESPKQEGLIYVGTDDGLIQITEDNGKTWKKISSFSGIPENTYVNAIVCSQHDANTVYAVFNNHKQGDFKPYILKSTDKGLTWLAVQGNLPKRGSVYDIAEDHINKNLLFAGTEFGAFFSIDGGNEWTQLKAGLPTIAVRDLEIQKRESDLVLASFGRGFYILDNYSALRTFSDDLFKKDAHIFPIKDGQMYIESSPMGMKGKSSQGESHYTAENPPLGVMITYLLNDTLKTAKENRRSAEAK